MAKFCQISCREKSNLKSDPWPKCSTSVYITKGRITSTCLHGSWCDEADPIKRENCKARWRLKQQQDCPAVPRSSICRNRSQQGNKLSLVLPRKKKAFTDEGEGERARSNTAASPIGRAYPRASPISPITSFWIDMRGRLRGFVEGGARRSRGRNE